MMKILVTGSNGQLGSELKFLQSEFPHFQFKFFDRKSWDITSGSETERRVAQEKPDVIVNCAAYTAVDKAEEEPQVAAKVNDEAVKHLADAAQRHDCFLIHFSTDYVFDGKSKKAYQPSDATNPLSVYGKTKLQGEKHVLKIDKGLVLRVSWLFSTFGNNFLKTMLRLGQERDELSVVNDQIASPTYARTLANDLLAVLQRWEKGELKPYGLFHYSHEGLASWFDFAGEIFRTEDIPVDLKPVTSEEFKTAAERPHFSKLDSSGWKNETGINPINWEESVKFCLKNLKKENE
ncbi:dTDP-4-dehydrorhamnose reductase [Halocola ammonii]